MVPRQQCRPALQVTSDPDSITDSIHLCHLLVFHINAGVVFTILAATGTFPASVEAMKARSTLGLTIAKYVLYVLSGICAYLAATSARDCLRRGRPTTLAKITLVLGSAVLVASATMTVVAMIISAKAQHPTPVWVYIIQALVSMLVRKLWLCFCFASHLV